MIAAAIAMLIGLGVAVAQHVYWSRLVEVEATRADLNGYDARRHERLVDDWRAAHAAEVKVRKDREADLEWARVVIATQAAPDMKPTILAEHRAKVLPIRGGAR